MWGMAFACILYKKKIRNERDGKRKLNTKHEFVCGLRTFNYTFEKKKIYFEKDINEKRFKFSSQTI